MYEWNREYYDIMMFYYWEPQHLGRAKNGEKISPDEIVKRLSRREVPLNHQMNLFMRLAPNSLIQDMLKLAYQVDVEDEFRFIGREFETLYDAGDWTQPDIMLVGEQTVFNIELKVGAKTKPEQLMKYALLNLLECRASGKRKNYYLLFMSPKDMADIWDKNSPPFEGLQRHICIDDIRSIPKRWVKQTEHMHDDVLECLREMHTAHLSYLEFDDFLEEQLSDSRDNETLTKLLRGMRAELDMRGYAS